MGSVGRFIDLPGVPAEGESPVFGAPWEAQAFALAVGLSEAGCFTWAEWTAVLGEEIRAAQGRGDPERSYYTHWLRALERICAEKGVVGDEEVRRRAEEWRRAYLNTPHGRPVELSAAFEPE